MFTYWVDLRILQELLVFHPSLFTWFYFFFFERNRIDWECVVLISSWRWVLYCEDQGVHDVLKFIKFKEISSSKYKFCFSYCDFMNGHIVNFAS